MSIEKTSTGEDIISSQEVGMTPNGSHRQQWNGKSPIKSTGTFVKSLTAGDYTLTVGKGVEYAS